MLSVKNARTRIEQLKGERNKVQATLSKTNQKVTEKKQELVYHEQAREIIRNVGVRTQSQLSYHISDISTLALESIFSDPYRLEVEFIQRRNKTECDLFFNRDGMQINPLSAAGGGVIDVASFALRVASWSMQKPRSRSTLLLDEPFKHLSTALLPHASAMLKQISERLGLQIILITHTDELSTMADKVYRMKMRSGRSVVQAVI